MYRTKTYIAGDWSGSKNTIDKIFEWNDNNKLSLNFTNVHDYTQSRDESLNCTIKRSLKERMNISKKFVLILNENTIELRSGACYLCHSFNHYGKYCAKGYSVSYESYVDYECRIAYNDYLEGKLDIVVIYESSNIHKEWCPDYLRSIGVHIPYSYYSNGDEYWNYKGIRDAII